MWEDISPESRVVKVLWRQWERLFLVRGVLHWRFYELEGRGWRHQLVVPEGRRQNLLQWMHGGAIGAHLGTARTLALVGQGFYWPGMRADMDQVCRKCDCALEEEGGTQGATTPVALGFPWNSWLWMWRGHTPSPPWGTSIA